MAPSTPIQSRDDLHKYLQVAIQLEHATLPPYITALYSIHPGTSLDASTIIRVVAIEEMLHLTLAANLLNAVGGTPDLNAEGFVPDYPTYLPTGQDDFEVGLEKFSRQSVDTFLNIERPAERPSQEGGHRVCDGICFVDSRQVGERRAGPRRGLLPMFVTQDEKGDDIHLHFYSIGDFYAAIKQGLNRLSGELGDSQLFCGHASRQVGPEYYYSGGGDVHVVTNLKTATSAIDLISEQGEGFEGGIYDKEGEISHYYRFQQLVLGKHYRKGDEADNPSGGPVDIDWSAVYPIKSNAKIADFEQSEELARAGRTFNTYYKEFLASVTEAFNGKPELLTPAVGEMFRLRNAAERLIRNPIPGENGTNAAPTFQMNEVCRTAIRG